MKFYFPRNWHYHNLIYILVAVELPFTIILLTFTGIASHNLYRTKLWQDGADNGFNSSPDEVVYAAANYRPYKVPLVWSDFITNYNLVIAVLSTFFMIVKLPVHVCKLFYPPVSALIQIGLIILYCYSAYGQAGPDMSDPKHPQSGAPWYITKKCSVAKDPDNIGYCQQTKALFAFTILTILLYVVELGFSIHSCFLSKEEKAERDEQREEKKTWKEYEDMILKSPAVFPPTTPGFPGTPGFSPGAAPTPRSLAFNRADGGTSNDLPLREQNKRHSLHQESAETLTPGSNLPPVQTYFPPPPKKAAKA